MKLDIHAPWSVNDLIKGIIEEKTNKLSKFYDRITHVDVFLKKEDHAHNGGEAHLTEIRVRIPGNEFFAHSNADNFERGIPEAVDKVTRQLKRKVDKMHAR